MRGSELVPAAEGTGPVSTSRFLNCNLCGREFGTASLPIHLKQCAEKHRVARDQLKPAPVKKFTARKVPAAFMVGQTVTSPLVVESKERRERTSMSTPPPVAPAKRVTSAHPLHDAPIGAAYGAVLVGEMTKDQYNQLAMHDYGKTAVDRGVVVECGNCGRKFGNNVCVCTEQVSARIAALIRLTIYHTCHVQCIAGRAEGLTKHRILCDQQGMNGGVFALKKPTDDGEARESQPPQPLIQPPRATQKRNASPSPAVALSKAPKQEVPAPEPSVTLSRFCTGCRMDFQQHAEAERWRFCPKCGETRPSA